MLKNNEILARKVKQNNQEFLVSVFSIKQLLSFTKFTYRIIEYFDENFQPKYNDQVQRKIEDSRIEKIADFLIDDPDATFPTNIVLSVPNVAIQSLNEIDETNISLVLNERVFTEVAKKNGDVYLTIIDGQHRIKGIEKAIERIEAQIQSLSKVNYKGTNEEIQKKLLKANKSLSNLLNINLVVTFFIDPTLEFQAMIFSTINRTQKSVPQSLVYSLFGLTQNDSPQKSSLEIVLALNGFEKSPFYNRIKLYGGKYDKNQTPPLTQATLVKSIIDLISINLRDSEKDRFKERRELKINCNDDLPFRKYYAENLDSMIIDILYSFFSAVRDCFNKNGNAFWNFNGNTKLQNILQTAAGYQALLLILIDILKIEKEDIHRDKIETYEKYLKKAKDINFDDQQRYPFTTLSRTILYLDISLKIWPQKNALDERIIKLDEALKKK
ncbi:MAG: DGQHR domain-containing protein [Limnohabitans sp.]|nr:DGQHR domain-containing protein [Limnohabitans sp.]